MPSTLVDPGLLEPEWRMPTFLDNPPTTPQAPQNLVRVTSMSGVGGDYTWRRSSSLGECRPCNLGQVSEGTGPAWWAPLLGLALVAGVVAFVAMPTRR